MLKIKKLIPTMVPVEVLKLRVHSQLSVGTVATGFKCSACGEKLGARRFGSAWIKDSQDERSLRLCWDCVQDARVSCKEQDVLEE